jgi:hypothetical protein
VGMLRCLVAGRVTRRWCSCWSGAWGVPAFGEGAALPGQRVLRGITFVAVCGDAAAGVAEAWRAAGGGLVERGGAPLAGSAGHGGVSLVSLPGPVTKGVEGVRGQCFAEISMIFLGGSVPSVASRLSWGLVGVVVWRKVPAVPA